MTEGSEEESVGPPACLPACLPGIKREAWKHFFLSVSLLKFPFFPDHVVLLVPIPFGGPF